MIRLFPQWLKSHILCHSLYFWCFCSPVIQNPNILWIPFRRLRSPHPLLNHQNDPVAQTHLTKPFFLFSNAPTPTYEDRQPNIDIINANHLTRRVKHVYVPIHYVHDKYALLTIDPFELKTTIQPSDIYNKSPTGPLLKLHYYYIHGELYYPLPDSYHWIRLVLDTLRTPYLPTDLYQYILKLS